MGKGHHKDDHRDRGKQHHHKNKRKHPERPCPNPPAAPNGLALTFKVREKKTHLEFSAKFKWNAVTQDEQGHKIPGGGVEIDHYEGKYWPTDAAGVPIEAEDGSARVRRFHVKANKGVKVIDAKASGTPNVATYTTKKVHGFVVGEEIRVQDIKPSAYNGRFTVASVVSTTKFTANIGQAVPSNTELDTEGTVEGEPDPNLNKIVEHIPNPRRWYWMWEVRAWDNKDCPSDWATSNTPLLPIQEAEPKPPAPTFVNLTFDRVAGHKHSAFRGKLKISPVRSWDIPGGDHEDDMASYHAKIEVSEDNGATWKKHKNLHVRDSDDEKDEDANILMVFHGVRRKFAYRATLWSVSRYHQKGDPAGPYPSNLGVSPGGSPNAVQNVSISSPGVRRLVARWDEPNQPEDIDYYLTQWYRRDGAGPTLVEQNRVRNRRDVYRIPKADKGKTHFCRVYAVDQDENQSTSVDSPDGADTETDTTLPFPPNVPGDPVGTFDALGTKHAKYRLWVTATDPVSDATHSDADYVLIRIAHAANDPANTPVSPPNGAKRQHGRFETDASGDNATEVFRNLPKNHFVWVQARGINAGGKSAWTSWILVGRPVDSAATSTPTRLDPGSVTIDTSNPRRAIFTWPERQNEDDARYHVKVYRGSTVAGGTLVDDGFTRNNRYVYRIPKADVGSNFIARVFVVNDLGVEETSGRDSTFASAVDDAYALPNPPNTPGVPVGTFDALGTKHAKYRLFVTSADPTVDATHAAADYLVVRMAHAATNPASTPVAPPAGAKRQHGRIEADASGDDASEVFRNIPKNHHVWVQTRAVNLGGSSPWTVWVYLSTPSASGAVATPTRLAAGAVTVDNTNPRRLIFLWGERQNEEDARYRIKVYKGSTVLSGTLVKDEYTRNTRYVYRVPKADVGAQHIARVFVVSDLGNEEASGRDSVAITPSDDAYALPNPPNTPGAPTGTFDVNGTKHARYRLVATVPDPTVDATHAAADYVVVRLAHAATNPGSTPPAPPAGAKRQHGRIEVDASGDDASEVFRNLPKDHHVWIQARGVNLGGESAWTAWVYCGTGNTDGATAIPTRLPSVTVDNTRPRRLIFTWDERLNEDDARFHIMVYRGSVATGTLVANEYIRNNRYVYRVPKLDVGANHVARVFVVSDTGGEETSGRDSTAAAASDELLALPNPPNVPGNPAGTFDALGTKHAKYRLSVTAADPVVDGSHPAADYILIRIAHAATNPASTPVAPPAGAKRQHGRIEADASGDDATEIFRNLPKNHHVWVQARGVNAGGESAWTSWIYLSTPNASGATSTPTRLTVGTVTVDNTRPRRLIYSWPERANEEDARYHVVIYRGATIGTGTIVEDQLTRNNRYVYRVPKADVAANHIARVFVVNDLGVQENTGSDSGSSVPTDDPSVTVKAPNTPSISSTSFDTQGTKFARFRAKVQVAVPAVDGTHDAADEIIIQLAHAETNPGTGNPPAGTPRQHGLVQADGSGIDLTETFKNIPRFHFVWARARARNTGGVSAYTGWTALGQPDGTTETLSAPTAVNDSSTSRRYIVEWADHPYADRYYVEILRGLLLVESKYTRDTRYVYRVPRGDVGRTHTANVYAVSETGTRGAVASSAGITIGEDNDLPQVGTVRKVSMPTSRINGLNSDWLLCDGATYTQTQWPDLYAKLLQTFGGSAVASPPTFAVPDHRRRKAKGTGTGEVFGSNEGDSENIRTDDIDEHKAGNVTFSGSHDHGAGSLVTGSATGTYITASGSAQSFPRPAHGHVISGSVNTTGSQHDHALGQNAVQGISTTGSKGHRDRPHVKFHYIIKT